MSLWRVSSLISRMQLYATERMHFISAASSDNEFPSSTLCVQSADQLAVAAGSALIVPVFVGNEGIEMLSFQIRTADIIN